MECPDMGFGPFPFEVTKALLIDYKEHFEKVDVRPMPKDLLKVVREHTQLRSCYNNTFNAVCMLKIHGCNNIEYVTGMGISLLPVMHAWICVDGVHYDPTWELHCQLGQEYYAVDRIKSGDLAGRTSDNKNYPPNPGQALLWRMDQGTFSLQGNKYE